MTDKGSFRDDLNDEVLAAMDEQISGIFGARPREAKGDTSSWAASRPTDLHRGFGRIVERTFVEDPEAEYEALERLLAVGERRTDHGTLMRALDEAETNARRAFRLWMTALVEHERWKAANEVVQGAMRSHAVASLQQEKSAGSRNKAITDADVEARMATESPKEYELIRVKESKVKAMVKSLEQLSEAWKSRCFSLRTMLDKHR